MSNACLFFYGFIPDELVLKTSDRNDIDSVFSSVGVSACTAMNGFVCSVNCGKFVRLIMKNVFGEM